MTFPRPIRRSLTALAAGAAVTVAGLGLYGNGEWAVAADARVSPVLAWNACLLDGKPADLGSKQPGISPDSRLSYRPRIDTDTTGQRILTGWVFFGYVTDDDTAVDFTCSTDASGTSPQWQTTPAS